MRDKRLVKGQQTKEDIISAAYELFLKQGYHGTSMRQIARQAEVAPSAIYNHFAGKEDIFVAVFLEHHPYNDVLPALLEASGETPEVWVHQAANRLVAALEKRPEFLNLMFIEMVEFRSSHAIELFETILPQALFITSRFIESQPRIRPIPPIILLRTFLGLFFSYYISEQFLGHNAPPEFGQNTMDHFVDIFLHGVLRNELGA